MTQADITILGLETSCDDTAAAIVRRASGVAAPRIDVLADKVASQVEDHRAYGGVVPEIAARAHVERLDGLILGALRDASLDWDDLNGVAATAGPGLIGGVMVGLSTAKAIALARGLPLIAVNHLEGHALSPRLAAPTPFPYLLLLVSGGHCQFLSVEGLGAYTRLGSTIDDAAGEAFDKTAKLLGLGYPGGPEVERAAKAGDPDAVQLPRPLLNRDTLDMSFAGLKTAVLRAAEAAPLNAPRIADLCASFQAAVADILGVRSRQAMAVFADAAGDEPKRFVVAGGVASNQTLRKRLEAEALSAGFSFTAPPVKWCTDNAAMIALAGAERLAAGIADPLDTPARSRWPLDADAAAAAPASGGGKRGAKA